MTKEQRAQQNLANYRFVIRWKWLCILARRCLKDIPQDRYYACIYRELTPGAVLVGRFMKKYDFDECFLARFSNYESGIIGTIFDPFRGWMTTCQMRDMFRGRKDRIRI